MASGSSTSTSTNTSGTSVMAGGVASDEQVTTFVQQLDAQGPAVVQQISTQLGDLACSQDTVQNLVDALHSGKSVTITSNVNGQTKSSTFNASGAHLGYGEAYVALALAAQELRNAGVTSCATPDQWQAALLGGPLNTTVSTTGTNVAASAGSSQQFPGIVTLHTQGQGWGQIAQSNNLQLGQVINSNATASTTNAANNNSPSPTGYSSSEMTQGRPNTTNTESTKPEKKSHWWNRGKNKDKDKDNDKTNERDPDRDGDVHTDTTPSTTPSGSATPDQTKSNPGR